MENHPTTTRVQFVLLPVSLIVFTVRHQFHDHFLVDAVLFGNPAVARSQHAVHGETARLVNDMSTGEGLQAPSHHHLHIVTESKQHLVEQPKSSGLTLPSTLPIRFSA